MTRCRSVAADRQIEPRKVTRLVRGDLDWIVMKSMEKDRTRVVTRRPTASRRDVERFLNQEPVDASPPSAVYRFRKFARRNRAALVMVSVVAIALVLGIVGTTWQAIRATDAENTAKSNLVLANDNLSRARQAVDDYFTAISENILLREAGMEPLRKDLLESALQYYLGFAEQQADNPSVLGELAAAHERIAQIYAATGSTQWVAAFERSLNIIERLSREKIDPIRWADKLAGAFNYQGDAPNVADPAEAMQVFQKGAQLYGTLAEAHPNVIAFQEELATVTFIVATIHFENGRPEQAIPNYERTTKSGSSSSVETLNSGFMHVTWRRSITTLRKATGVPGNLSTRKTYIARRLQRTARSTEMKTSRWSACCGNWP